MDPPSLGGGDSALNQVGLAVPQLKLHVSEGLRCACHAGGQQLAEINKLTCHDPVQRPLGDVGSRQAMSC